MQCVAVVHARVHRARGHDWLWHAHLMLDSSFTQESGKTLERFVYQYTGSCQLASVVV